MVITRTPNVILIKRNVTSANCVRIGVLTGTMTKDGVTREFRIKPHNDYTIGECQHLLEQMEALPSEPERGPVFTF